MTVTLNETTRCVVQALLQARLDGRLQYPSDILEVINQKQPAEGLSMVDMSTVNAIAQELGPCNIIPEAKKLAAKYALTLVY